MGFQEYSYLLNNDKKTFNVLFVANENPMNKEAREWILKKLISNHHKVENANIKFFIIGLDPVVLI